MEPVVLRASSDLLESSIPNDLKPKAILFKLLKNAGGSMYEKDLYESFSKSNTSFEKQLKIEMDYGWITESSAASTRVVSVTPAEL
ncbi:hypothetical protein [Chromobacterium vaccinii]|uniref:hypothetical protein n=1 Tax=Chromobacterium vaccinii TaxID=1108595 RepID=UPI001C92EB9C|nr:hypothetical protein [Chromobacterium vaccinii]